MGKYDYRKYYNMLLNRLRKECGEPTTDTTVYSDFTVLLQINKYLAKLGCCCYTIDELNDISSNMA